MPKHRRRSARPRAARKQQTSSKGRETEDSIAPSDYAADVLTKGKTGVLQATGLIRRELLPGLKQKLESCTSAVDGQDLTVLKTQTEDMNKLSESFEALDANLVSVWPIVKKSTVFIKEQPSDLIDQYARGSSKDLQQTLKDPLQTLREDTLELFKHFCKGVTLCHDLACALDEDERSTDPINSAQSDQHMGTPRLYNYSEDLEDIIGNIMQTPFNLGPTEILVHMLGFGSTPDLFEDFAKEYMSGDAKTGMVPRHCGELISMQTHFRILNMLGLFYTGRKDSSQEPAFPPWLVKHLHEQACRLETLYWNYEECYKRCSETVEKLGKNGLLDPLLKAQALWITAARQLTGMKGLKAIFKMSKVLENKRERLMYKIKNLSDKDDIPQVLMDAKTKDIPVPKAKAELRLEQDVSIESMVTAFVSKRCAELWNYAFMLLALFDYNGINWISPEKLSSATPEEERNVFEADLPFVVGRLVDTFGGISTLRKSENFNSLPDKSLKECNDILHPLVVLISTICAMMKKISGRHPRQSPEEPVLLIDRVLGNEYRAQFYELCNKEEIQKFAKWDDPFAV